MVVCKVGGVTEWDRKRINRGWTNKLNSHWYSMMKECNFCLAKAAVRLFCYESFLKSTTITDSNGETGEASGTGTSLPPNNNTLMCAHTFFRFVSNPFRVKSTSSQLSLPALWPWNSNSNTKTVSPDALIHFSTQNGYEAQQGLPPYISSFISSSLEQHCGWQENGNRHI